MESYSCKMIGSEKQLYKKFAGGRDPQGVEALSPPTNGYGGYAFSTSPYSRSRSSGSEDEGVGVLCDTISRSVELNYHYIITVEVTLPNAYRRASWDPDPQHQLLPDLTKLMSLSWI